MPMRPPARATLFPSTSASTSTLAFAGAPAASTRTTTRDESTSGRMSSAVTWAAGTGSSQTDCQIPVTDVYQMPWGRATCFPRG